RDTPQPRRHHISTHDKDPKTRTPIDDPGEEDAHEDVDCGEDVDEGVDVIADYGAPAEELADGGGGEVVVDDGVEVVGAAASQGGGGWVYEDPVI
ncbi:hypothetical protein HK102_009747, partial [Quaeritorhiza haematococci]